MCWVVFAVQIVTSSWSLSSFCPMHNSESLQSDTVTCIVANTDGNPASGQETTSVAELALVSSRVCLQADKIPLCKGEP